MSKSENEEYLNTYKILNITVLRLKEQIKIASDESKKSYYISELNKALKNREKIENDIEKVKNPIEKEVLFLRYLCGKTLEETAEMLHYSCRHTGRIQSSALENLKIS